MSQTCLNPSQDTLSPILSGGALSRTQRDTEVASTELNVTGRTTGVSVGPYIEVLRGRDGRDGRDGKDGERGETGNQGEPGIQGPPGPPAPPSGGVVYTRWGRTTCPDTQGTELLYEGIAGGSAHNHKGGGANYLCLPEEPEYSDYQPGAYIYATTCMELSMSPTNLLVLFILW